MKSLSQANWKEQLLPRELVCPAQACKQRRARIVFKLFIVLKFRWQNRFVCLSHLISEEMVSLAWIVQEVTFMG